MNTVRAIVASCMALAGLILLSGGYGFGPCGGGNAYWNPSPMVGFILGVIGLEMVVGSYFVVKQNRGEGNFRMLVYAVLFCGVIGVAAPIMWSPRSVTAGDSSLVLFGFLAAANLVFFWKRVGVGPQPRKVDPHDNSANAYTKSLLLWDAVVLGPAIILLSARIVELLDPLAFMVCFFALGAACVGMIFLSVQIIPGSSQAIAIIIGLGVSALGGAIMANVFGGFESSTAAWSMGLVLSIPSAIACAVIAKRREVVMNGKQSSQV